MFCLVDTNKWHMNKPESFLENESHKSLCDFEIEMDHQILARRSNLIIADKNMSLPNCRPYLPGETQSKNERKRKGTSTWPLPVN